MSTRKHVSVFEIVNGTWEQECTGVDFEGHTNILNGQKLTCVKESGVVSGGNGLFAARNFEPNELLGFYGGVVVCDTDLSTDDCTVEYVLTLHRFDEEQNIDVPITVDARNAGVLSRGNVHMANDGRSVRKNNALFTWYGFLRTTTRIRANEEIFVSYGCNYWSGAVKLLDMLHVRLDISEVYVSTLTDAEKKKLAIQEVDERAANIAYYNQFKTMLY